MAVTAFNAKDLEQRGYNSLEDIAAKTPGFTFEPFISGGVHSSPVIRGLAQTFINNRIQNVSFFLNGVYLQRQSIINMGMIDMERVEVVKGPQNALYGRNAFAGAVNYITLEPGSNVEGYLSLGSGDNDRRQYRASLSGPILGSDAWTGKVSVGLNSYDGHTRNNHPMADADPPGPNARGNLGGFEDATYSASLSWAPLSGFKSGLSFYRSAMEHEAQPGYAISGVNAARFGLRFDNQNDLNCNVATVRDIQPQPERYHTGFSAWCGELPRYASDVAPRTVSGIVIDPRPIGTITDADIATFTAEYAFNDDLSVHYLFGFTDMATYTDGGASDEDPLAGRGFVTNAYITSVDNQDPAGYTFINTTSGRPNSEMTAMSHELRFDWQFSPALRTSLGGYFSTVDDEEWTTLFINDLCNADTPENMQNCNEPLTAPNSVPEQTVATGTIPWDQVVRQHGGQKRGEWLTFDESIMAVFASATYQFNEMLDGTLEGRFSVEKKAITRLTDSFMLAPGESVTYDDPRVQPPPPAPGSTLSSTITVPYDDETFTEFSPRGILRWTWAPTHMVFGSIAQGHKAGGFNNANSESELTFDPETNWTYEIGSKNRFGRALTLNGSLYYVDWSDLQGNQPPAVVGISTSDIIVNLGGAKTLGVEVESVYHLTDALSIDLGGTWSDPKYKDGTKFAAGRQDTGQIHCDGVTCPADGDISGNQIARTSKVQWSFGLNHAASLGNWTLFSRLDTDYRSRQYVEPLNLAWVPERQLVNASFTLGSPDQHWELGAWGKNLTNEDYPANMILIGVFNQYMVGKGPARTLGLNLKYKFF